MKEYLARVYVPSVLVWAALACCSGAAFTAPPIPQTPQSARDLPSVPAGRPIAGGYGVAARGRGDYATYCAPCHGSRGDGDGPLSHMLVPRPARHSDAAFMRTLTDEYLFNLLKEGGPALGKSPRMGAWGKILSEQRIRDLVAFLRSLAQPSERKELPREDKELRDPVKIKRSPTSIAAWRTRRNALKGLLTFST